MNPCSLKPCFQGLENCDPHVAKFDQCNTNEITDAREAGDQNNFGSGSVFKAMGSAVKDKEMTDVTARRNAVKMLVRLEFHSLAQPTEHGCLKACFPLFRGRGLVCLYISYLTPFGLGGVAFAGLGLGPTHRAHQRCVC